MKRLALVCGGMMLIGLIPPAAADRNQPVGCGWPTKLNEDTFNFVYPDTAATYWGIQVPYVHDGRLRIEGRYPEVRYFSFHAYDPVQRPVDSIADNEIVPDSGTNPFSERRSTGGDYTVFVDFSAPPESPEENTVYAGEMRDGNRNTTGFVLYRIYIPDGPREPTGGVPLPQVTLEAAGGEVELEFGECEPLPPDAGGEVNEVIKEGNWPLATGTGSRHPAATDPFTFKRFYGTDQFPRDFLPGNAESDSAEAQSEGGFLSNHHVAYLYAYIVRGLDELAVVRLKAPTFPDTREGESPVVKRQVRYWSVCQNNGLSQRVVDCVSDHEVRPDKKSYVTVVISSPEHRPDNLRRGEAWLPWGAYPEGLIIYRHMLPAKSFRWAIQNIPEGESASEHTGTYYPRGSYCSKETFEAEGAAGCLD